MARPRKYPPSPVETLLSPLFDADNPALRACWPGAASMNDPRLHGKGTINTTRYLYEVLVGPLEPSQALRRRCKTPGCRNPWHHQLARAVPSTKQFGGTRLSFIDQLKEAISCLDGTPGMTPPYNYKYVIGHLGAMLDLPYEKYPTLVPRIARLVSQQPELAELISLEGFEG